MADAHDSSIGQTWSVPTAAQAQDFFDQLRVASQKTRLAWTGRADLSTWGDPGWPDSRNVAAKPTHTQGPIGAIVHYTASCEPKGTVRWFCDPSLAAKASAHFVVCQALEWPAEVPLNCPLVAALPAAVVLCRNITDRAWHATWCNDFMVGFELVNQGCETAETTNRPVATALAKRVPYWGRLWQPYTPQQSATVAIICRYLMALYPNWRSDYVLGHENVQMRQTPGTSGYDKRDPGPLLDLAALVTAAADKRFVMSGLPLAGGSLTAANLLARLRYNIGQRTALGGSRDYLISTYPDQLRIFQYAAGLVPDEVAGPKTLAALTARVADREGT